MRRLLAIAIVLAAASAACSEVNLDIEELRGDLTRSQAAPREFTYRSLSDDSAFAVRGRVADDLRSAMTLELDGRPVLDYVVADDALAVRLLDTAFGGRLSNTLGDPVVDRALRAGRWVVDPTGAPPLTGGAPGTAAAADTPFVDASRALRRVGEDAAEAGGVLEFTLENPMYRPAYDPWRYPEGEELRYDFIRPPLPKTESQASGRAGIGPALFRKASVYVRDGRVTQSCSIVDVDGHEDVLELEERGAGSNPYLEDLLEQIAAGLTAVPVVQRTVLLDVKYPDDVGVELPADGVTGKLTVFTAAFDQAVTAGLLRPSATPVNRMCRRASVDG